MMAPKAPTDVIPTLSYVHGGVLRFSSGITAVILTAYQGWYWQTILLVIVVFGYFVRIGTPGYLIPRYKWYRHWLGWVLLVNAAGFVLVLASGKYLVLGYPIGHSTLVTSSLPGG